MKKAYTLIELVVVLLLMSFILGLGIKNINDSGTSNEAVQQSMIFDANNEAAYQNSRFVISRDYEAKRYEASKGNTVETTLKTCGDGTPGYVIHVTNENKTYSVDYDSCTDGSPILN